MAISISIFSIIRDRSSGEADYGFLPRFVAGRREIRHAPAASLVAVPEVIPANPDACADEHNDDSNPAEGSQLRPLRGNAAKRLPTRG